MNIERKTPSVGYLDPDLFAAIGVSQIVRVGNTVHLSGVVSASHSGVVAPGDPAGQVTRVLDLIERFLATERMTYANVVTATVFSPVLDKVSVELPQFAKRFKDHPPCLTMIGCKDLASPDYLVEMTVIAMD